MKFLKKIFSKIVNKFKRKKAPSENAVMSSSIILVDQNSTKKDKSVLDVDLIDNNASESDKGKVRQYTKILITALTICACIWVSSSYILATVALVMYGNAELLSTLSEKVCEVILGAVSAYCLKAFFETFAQRGMELIDNRLNNKTSEKEDESIDFINNDEDEIMG